MSHEVIVHPLDYLGPLVGFHYLPELLSGWLAGSTIIAGPKGIGKSIVAGRIAQLILKGASRAELNSATLMENRSEAIFSHPDLCFISSDYKLNCRELKNREGITIDELRQAQHFMTMNPASASHRLLIIDGLEYLTLSAANSLLKMLEEPNKAIILLITSKITGLLPTIRSRCITWHMRRPSEPELLIISGQQREELSTAQLRGYLTGGERLTSEIEHVIRLISRWKGEETANRHDMGELLIHLQSILNKYTKDSVNLQLWQRVIVRLASWIIKEKFRSKLNYFILSTEARMRELAEDASLLTLDHSQVFKLLLNDISKILRYC